MMNFSTLSFILLLPFLSQILAAGERVTNCVHFTTRREWRMMDSDFRRRYISAVRDMQSSGSYAYFPQLHYNLNFRIHGNAVFLPWHRYFVSVFELQVQNRDSTLHVPYWDSSYDSQAPEASPIWGNDDASFGLSGEGFDRCVRTGPFANWIPQFPNSHCLQRTFGPGSRAYPSLESVNEALSRISRFDDIAEYLEGDVHAYVHAGIGGDMAVMSSPNDPVFFLHHSNIDRLWYNWQKMRPNVRFSEYGGMRSIHYLDLNRFQVTTATSDYPLPGYENIRVGDILHPDALCYEYIDREGVEEEEGALFSPAQRPSLEQESENIKESDLRDNSTTLTLIKSSSPAINITQGRRLIKLRRVEPLSDEWIKMNFLNATFVRANEVRLNRIVDSLNRIRGYVSPSAIWNRPDLFHKLVKNYNVRYFEATIIPNASKFRAALRNTTNPAQALVTLKSKILNAANKNLVVPSSIVKPQVLKVIGGKAVLRELNP